MESSSTRDWTHVPCTGRQILIHCTTREILRWLFVLSEIWLLSYSFFFLLALSLYGCWRNVSHDLCLNECSCLNQLLTEVFWKERSPSEEWTSMARVITQPKSHCDYFFLPFFPSVFFFLATPCSMWDLIPQPGVKHRSYALEVWSLNNLTTKEALCFFNTLLHFSCVTRFIFLKLRFKSCHQCQRQYPLNIKGVCSHINFTETRVDSPDSMKYSLTQWKWIFCATRPPSTQNLTPELVQEAQTSTFWLSFCFLFFFWLHHVVCGILVPWSGIEPVAPAVEAWSLNHWTARQVPRLLLSEIAFWSHASLVPGTQFMPSVLFIAECTACKVTGDEWG